MRACVSMSICTYEHMSTHLLLQVFVYACTCAYTSFFRQQGVQDGFCDVATLPGHRKGRRRPRCPEHLPKVQSVPHET